MSLLKFKAPCQHAPSDTVTVRVSDTGSIKLKVMDTSARLSRNAALILAGYISDVTTNRAEERYMRGANGEAITVMRSSYYTGMYGIEIDREDCVLSLKDVTNLRYALKIAANLNEALATTER